MNTRTTLALLAAALLTTTAHAQSVATHFQATDPAASSYFMGKVGIGTTTPSWPFHLLNSTTIVQIEASAAGAHGFVLKDATQQWNFLTANNSSDFKIRNATAGVDTLTLFGAGGISLQGGNLRLNQNWISADGQNEGIFITNAGDVGVGTNSPVTTFHVVDSTAILQVESTGTGAQGFVFKDANQQWNFISASGSDDFKLRDSTSGIDAMYLQKGGNVGFGGNVAPNATLHVAGTGIFEQGIVYTAALGDLSMGSYTNRP